MFNRWAAMLGILMTATLARGADHLLTIGGGGSPTNNQISLEKNILYFQRFLNGAGLSGLPNDIFFATGTEQWRDIQYVDNSAAMPKANLLLAQLFGTSEKSMYTTYRPHHIVGVQGAANRASLSKWFDNTGTKLREGDRLLIYFTGHGGRGGRENSSRNTTMQMWNEQGLSVKDFTAMLDKLDPKVSVVLVMVQCFSGGFADVIFSDPQNNKLSAANRCGFFATVHDREAAGCTPDISEEDYKEYSTYFWAALYGKTRLGDAIQKPDYDGDGKVSFDEAHAYVQLTSETIDIPVCTSDSLLRAFSRIKSDEGYVLGDSPYQELMSHASAAQKAVIAGLSEQLKIFGNQRWTAAKKSGEQFDRDKRNYEQQQRRLNTDLNQVRGQLQATLRLRWPEIGNAWNPKVHRMIQEEGAAMVRTIEGHPSYKRYQELTAQRDELDAKARMMEKKWVKCQRLQRELDTVALGANLHLMANDEVQQKYREILAAEGGTLGEGR